MIYRTTNYTSKMMLNDVLSQQAKLYDKYNNIINNTRFSNVSEDPVASSSIIGVQQQMAKIESYMKNIKTADSAINVQDGVFGTVIEKMDRINELTVQAANGASGTNGIDAIKTEILELTDTIVGLANTNFNDMYIFAGANVNTLPFSYDKETGAVSYQGTTDADPASTRSLEIANGVFVDVNSVGSDVFGAYDPDNPDDETVSYGLFKTLGDLRKALDSQDYDEIRAQLDKIQGAAQNVSEIQSVYSAKISKLTMTESNHQNTKILLESKKQSLQEIDSAEAISEFVKQNYAYQASMQVFMQMQNNSLMNYM